MKKRTLKFKRDVVGTLSPSQLATATGGVTGMWCWLTITRDGTDTCQSGCTQTQYTCGACSSETSGTGCR